MMTTTRTAAPNDKRTPAAAVAATPTSAPASTESYAAGYAKLSAIADRLRTATGAANVDTLLADVQTARRLHKDLKARLDAVRRELDADAAIDGDSP